MKPIIYRYIIQVFINVYPIDSVFLYTLIPIWAWAIENKTLE